MTPTFPLLGFRSVETSLIDVCNSVSPGHVSRSVARPSTEPARGNAPSVRIVSSRSEKMWGQWCTNQPVQRHAKAVRGPVIHAPCGKGFSGSDRNRRVHVDDHRIVQIHHMIGELSENADPNICPCPARGGGHG